MSTIQSDLDKENWDKENSGKENLNGENLNRQLKAAASFG
jgi:hypothetical protein